MPWGSCRLDVETRGSPPPLPHHLVCVEKFTFPYLALGALFMSTSLDRASWHGVQGTLSATFEAATGSLPPGVSPAV